MVNLRPMELQFVILKPEDADQILALDRKVYEALHEDPMEQQLAQWHSRARQESLDHYLPLGWSFGLFNGATGDATGDGTSSATDSEKLVGYFLAQPLLFYAGITQTLWVEKIGASSSDMAFRLIDTAVRLAREKHFQRALFSDCDSYVSLLKDLKGQALSETIYEVRTSKMV